jgi:hypothetical protein
MNNQLELEQLLSQWQLNQDTQTILLKFPDVVESLITDKSLPNFPEDYSPQNIEILLNDICYIKITDGKLSRLKDCPPGLNCHWLEYRFDGECALFICNGEAIVDRLELIANLERKLDFTSLLNPSINI